MGPGVEFPRGAGLWIPLGVDARTVQSRGATFLQAIARVGPGFSREVAAAKVKALFQRLAVDHPDAYTRTQQGVVTPLAEYWTGSARLHLWIMLGASLLLLAASIISAGNLLLSRTLAREAEIATRLALGAGRGQIMAQLGAEGAVVALIAVAAGLGIGELVIRVLVRWAPADIPRLAQTALDFGSFSFAAGTAVLATAGCSVLPAWSATRMHVESALREGSARLSSSRRGSGTRSVFVLTQTAVTVVLLAMATFLLLSYRAMMTADIGFENRDALSMNLQLRGPGLAGSRAMDLKTRRQVYAQLLQRLREAPGVTSAAAILTRPLEGPIGWDVPYDFDFEPRAAGEALPKANYEAVTPDYFKTVGTALVEGRDFDEHDSADAEPVIIISQPLAQRIRAAGLSPLGYRLRIGLGPRGGYKVVGVAAEARYRSITQRGADLFVPYTQAGQGTNYLLLRGNRTAPELAALARKTLAEVDSTQAVAGIATLGELIDRNAARHRFNMILLGWFGACAVVLAAMGIYSVIAEGVTGRRREIAIKTVLGARKPRLVREIVYRALGFVLAGEAAGLVLIAGFGRLGSELLYEVSPRDPRILGGVLGLLFVVSLVAALFPAWAAAGRNPNAALRE
jgi:predicted permease